MPLYRLFSVFVICCALTIAGCSKSSTEAGLEKEDLDGDGIGNIYDPDIDGDGIPNGQDPDIDGDGTPNGQDPSPGTNTPNYCDQIHVLGLNKEQSTGSIISITWELQSSKTNGDCVLKDGVTPNLVAVNASAAGAKSTTSERTNPVINTRTRIRIPAACTGETVEVTYDFIEIADVIKADPNAPGWTVKQRHRGDAARCDIDGDGLPDFGLQCPAGATGDGWPDCDCPDGQGYDAASNTCKSELPDGGQQCPDGATGTYPNCECPDERYDEATNKCCACEEPNNVYNEKTNQCCSGDPLGSHDNCIETCQASYLNCLWRCDTAYCSEQCGKRFNTCKCGDGEKAGCDGCWGEESNCKPFDQIPNLDVDNDGIRNDSDQDIDGDGIENKNDPDIDGDGISNGIDPDADGDGIPDAEDDTPGGPQ